MVDVSANAAAVPSLVGRDREMVELASGLDDVIAGRGHLFLVGGDPGIGKSRLADEMAVRAQERGFRVAWGRCWEAGGAPAYWPWVQSLRVLVRGLDGEELASQLGVGAPFVAQIVPEINEILPQVGSPPPMQAEEGRFRLFDAVSAFIHNSGAARPVMIVLDDLHAADTPSLLLLQFVARELANTSVLVLGAYRGVALGRDHPLTFALAELSRERVTHHIPLFGLGQDDIGRLIQQITGRVPGDRVVSAIHRETEGNPLFASEVVRLLTTEGQLELGLDPEGLRLSIPEGIRDVIGRRVAHLSEECNHVLALASIFGREFLLEALARLCERPVGEVLDMLDEGVAARVVSEVPGVPGGFRFSHALIRDTMYEGVLTGRRLRLHWRAGEVLEELYKQRLDPHLAELAHHFFEGAPTGDAVKAADYAFRAGQRATELLAYEEAVRLWRMALAALDLVGGSDEQTRCRFLLALGDALNRMGDRSAAKGELLRVAEIARQEGMADEMGQAALAYGGRVLFERGASDPRLIPLLEEAEDMLGDRQDALRVRVLARLAAAMRDQPERGPREALSRRAVDIARGLDDPSTLAFALAARGAALYGPDDSAGMLALAEETRRIARAVHEKELEALGEQNRWLVLLQTGRMADCHVAIDSMHRLAEDLRQPAYRWFAEAAKGTVALLEGRFADAESLVESAHRFGELSHPWEASVFRLIQGFSLRREDGRLAELEPSLRRAVEAFPTRPIFRCVLASCLAELGDLDGAEDTVAVLARTRFANIPVNNDFLLSIAELTEVSCLLRDTDRVAVLYDLLLPYRGMVVDTCESSTGAVDRYLGIAAMTAGRLDLAERHLLDAMKLNKRISARPWLVRTQRDLARLWISRDRPGDHDNAIELLRTALGTADELGMTSVARRITEDLNVGGIADLPDRAREPGPSHDYSDPKPTSATLRREGEFWAIAYENDAFRLRDTKGLYFLAHLLENPGREIHVLDLITVGPGPRADLTQARSAPEDGLNERGLSDAGPILDDQAKTAYRARFRELEDELNEATAWADAARVSLIRVQMQFLADELSSAVGLGGRDRRALSASERARVNVTRAVRTVLRRIRQHSPALASHLDTTIHTGTFCSYSPDPRAPLTWHT